MIVMQILPPLPLVLACRQAGIMTDYTDIKCIDNNKKSV